MASTTAANFGAAVQAAAELQVPASEQGDTTVKVEVSETSEVSVDLGALLDLSVSEDRVKLVMGAQAAACRGMDGTCTVTLGSSRRLRARGLSSATTLNIDRQYNYGTSANASVSLVDQIEGKVNSVGATILDATQTALSSTTTVETMGAADGSAVDDAFANPTTLNEQLSLRLPGTGVSVSAARVIEPPSPPPPPPPLAPPPSPPSPPPPPFADVNGTGNATAQIIISNDLALYGFGLATGIAIVGCFIAGYVFAKYRSDRKKKLHQVVPNAVTINGQHSRVGADGGAKGGGGSEEEEDTWRVPTPRGGTSSRTSNVGAAAQADDAAGAIPPPPKPPMGLLSSLLAPSTNDLTDGVVNVVSAGVTSNRGSNRVLLAPLGGGGEPSADRWSLRSVPDTDRLSSSASTSALQPAAAAEKPKSMLASKSMASFSSKVAPERAAPDRPAPALPPGRQLPAGINAVLASNRIGPAPPAAANPATRLSGRSAPVLTSSPSSVAWGDHCASEGAAAAASAAGGAEYVAQNMSIDVIQNTSHWSKVRMAQAKMKNDKTMFDDGRYLQSVVQEAKAAGLSPTRGRGNVKTNDPAPLLRKMTKKAMAKEPMGTPLAEGVDGGGGVRLFPPNLIESLPEYSDCFSTAVTSAAAAASPPVRLSRADGSQGSTSTWAQRPASSGT